jgi:hypothetical protein
VVRSSAVADELAGRPQGGHPEPEAFLPVEALVPVDPGQSFVPIFRARVVPHHLGVAEESSHVVEVVCCHPAEREPLGRGRDKAGLVHEVSLLGRRAAR